MIRRTTILIISGFIIDTRTPAAINSARNKGGGLESDVYYPAWKKITKSIDRFHFLLDSYSKLMEACCDTSSSHDKWLNRLALSSWLTHVKEILNCGCLVAQCVDQVRKINWSQGVSLCVIFFYFGLTFFSIICIQVVALLPQRLKSRFFERRK